MKSRAKALWTGLPSLLLFASGSFAGPKKEAPYASKGVFADLMVGANIKAGLYSAPAISAEIWYSEPFDSTARSLARSAGVIQR